MNYTVTETPAVKVTVTISRHQLWKNFIDCWADAMWDSYNGVDTIKEVADVLLSGTEVHNISINLSKLFRDGYTCMLLGDAMCKFDCGKSILMEVVVCDVGSDGSIMDKCIIKHENINF